MTKAPPPPPPVTRLEPRVAQDIPPRITIHAVEGWGKTSMLASAPDPLILMCRGETGYDTLLSNGLVPAVPAQEANTWDELLGWIDRLTTEDLGIKTLGFDAIGGVEQLCHEKVCMRDFRGDWTNKGFLNYHRGYDVAIRDWLIMQARLDRLRATRQITVVFLSHSKIENFSNPQGDDYHRYTSSIHYKAWDEMARWSDAILFGNFVTVVKDGKSTGGADRILYTERRNAFAAKNRFKMPPEISIPNDPLLVWQTVWNAMFPAS